ncbi:FAD-dependent oxidoreductase [Variovorax atrisoli]
MLPRRSTTGGVDNLLVAGRCASMTHNGQSAARVTGACFVMGRAAGAAAALAVSGGVSVHEIDVKTLQRTIESQSAFHGRGSLDDHPQ